MAVQMASAVRGLSQQSLELGQYLLNRIEVGLLSADNVEKVRRQNLRCLALKWFCRQIGEQPSRRCS